MATPNTLCKTKKREERERDRERKEKREWAEKDGQSLIFDFEKHKRAESEKLTKSV